MNKYVWSSTSSVWPIYVNGSYYFYYCPQLWVLSQNSEALGYNPLDICITQILPSSTTSSSIEEIETQRHWERYQPSLCFPCLSVHNIHYLNSIFWNMTAFDYRVSNPFLCNGMLNKTFSYFLPFKPYNWEQGSPNYPIFYRGLNN